MPQLGRNDPNHKKPPLDPPQTRICPVSPSLALPRRTTSHPYKRQRTEAATRQTIKSKVMINVKSLKPLHSLAFYGRLLVRVNFERSVLLLHGLPAVRRQRRQLLRR